MTELYEEWAQTIKQAENRARAAGRTDVMDYLALRASNDLIRQTSIKWLMESFISTAAIANRHGADISISQEDTHRFSVGNASMGGSLLTLKSGVRELDVEAGWPRGPRDGIVRGGGLACGNVKHFGNSGANDQLLLVSSKEGKSPEWLVLDKNGDRVILLSSSIGDHVARLLGKRG